MCAPASAQSSVQVIMSKVNFDSDEILHALRLGYMMSWYASVRAAHALCLLPPPSPFQRPGLRAEASASGQLVLLVGDGLGA